MGFYDFSRTICIFFFRLYFKIEVKGLENFQNFDDGAIMISNHKSNLDPIFLGLFFKRRLFFMAKKELFCVPILKNIIKKLGAFPVERGKNADDVIKKAVEMIKSGKIVAMFPQGHRCKRIEDKGPKTGFIRIALDGDFYIIPCLLLYKSFLPRSRVLISYEKPVKISELVEKEKEDLKTRLGVKKISLKVWQMVLDLKREEER